RQILKALIASNAYDISVKCLGWGNTSLIHDSSPFFEKITELSAKFAQEQQSEFKDYDLSVQVTIPNEFEKLAKLNIGITAGIEVNLVSPEWIVKSNEMVDILFVPSQHSKDVFEKTVFKDDQGRELRLNKPAHLAHEGFNPKYFNTDSVEGDVEDFSTKFNFLFVGLGISKKYGEERKNISNLVKWFCETFKGNKDVGLVLKTAIVNNSLLDFTNTKAMLEAIKSESDCGEFPKIHLIHGKLSDQAMANLYKNPKVKAFVTLTHGEGFGLPLLEAAACGVPIMATNWSGHLDFLQIPNEKNSFVSLDFDLKQVPESAVWKGVIEQGSQWASVKEEDVKLKLRKVHASYDKPKEWATKLATHVHENFHEGKVMYKLVQDIIRLSNEAFAGGPTNSSSPTDVVNQIKSSFTEEDEGLKLLYTMPMSAGDVYISSAVVSGLKKKFPDHKIFFATNEQYASILKGNKEIHRVTSWREWMSNISICEKIFDEVYTPNLAVQMTFSNWVHGGKGRLLANELANQCNVELGDYFIETSKPDEELPKNYIVLNPGSGKGQWEARNYTHWQELISNLVRELGDIAIVQTGMSDDPLYIGCVDFRGKTKDYGELASVIEGAKLVLGIDSVTMHLAAGLGVDHIALFGSSYSTSTGPVVKKKCLSLLLETGDRRGCDKACYKYQCSVDKDYPCINEIHPETVYHHVLDEVLNTNAGKYGPYKEINPKISGYTHVFNAEAGGYPFVESIQSMLGFCDEIIVIDGGSEDGTIERINEIGDDRIKLVERKWDWTEPGMDGQQKAYGRAMCTGDFLWQQDVDEVVHEDDYNKIRKLVKRFPNDCSLLHLPIIELWGDEKTVRTDRHSWKWRLSRSDFKITHGIAKHARVLDEETGKIYAKRGQSDGCEYIDIMTNEYVPHKGFYSQQIENIRSQNPEAYGNLMQQVFEQLPSVYHYSWANIPRKIRNFKQFWDKCWTNLYREQKPEDRFPDVSLDDEESIILKSAELKKQGGEHELAPTFQLNRSNPKIMKEWLK
ncbi:MAG: glycosyltransferase family 9 protein, partial [Candidatus Thorarchaeota archaeon]